MYKIHKPIQMSQEGNVQEVEQQQQETDGFTTVNYQRRPRLNKKDVLNQVATGELKPDEAERLLQTRRSPRFVVTKNGAIALYNLQKQPVILYADQWERLSRLVERDILKKFIERNENIIRRRPRPDQDQENVELEQTE